MKKLCIALFFGLLSLGLSSQAQTAVNIDSLTQQAESGNPQAQRELGVCYYKGDGVPQDYTEAVKWFLKAAEQGDATAQLCIGNCYDFGNGVPQDYSEAVKW